jgi:hypothetical protein
MALKVDTVTSLCNLEVTKNTVGSVVATLINLPEKDLREIERDLYWSRAKAICGNSEDFRTAAILEKFLGLVKAIKSY